MTTLKILRLAASNVLRLKAVEINPSGTVQIVGGRNGAGKSSVLNAFYLALAGGAASREIAKPVRAGEEWAEVKVDIGDEKGVSLIVTRSWDDTGKTTLTVKAPDGASYKSPQTLLDGLLGSLSFDPLAFTRMPPKAQREKLLELLGLDFSAADAERARLYELRRDTGQRKHAYGELPKLPKNAPTTELPATTILARIRQAREEERRIEQHRTNISFGLAELDRIDAEMAALEKRKADVMSTLDEERSALDAAPVPEDIDTLQTEVENLEERNRQARENRRIVEAREAQKRLEEEYTGLSRQIDAIDESKAAAIAAADMPVPGLGFDADGVTFNGVPFGQASSAEQIRVSLAMAMGMNPPLRVIRIMDGSLLDADSMAEIRAAAEEHDVQVWIEVVGDTSADPASIVIEDGEVVQR